METVLSLRLPPELLERVDAVAGTHDTRARVLRELLVVGLEHYDPEAHRAKQEQAKRDARIREPEWAPHIRELHARGLTNAAIAAATGLTHDNVRQRLFRLRLPANR